MVLVVVMIAWLVVLLLLCLPEISEPELEKFSRPPE